MSDDWGVEWVLPNGADVEVEGRDETLPSDRVEFTAGGMVKLFHMAQYEMSVYPAERIESIRTYTEHVEDKEWFR
jgi:hypothetical protein